MTARKRRRLNDAGIFFDLAAVDGSEEDDDDDDWEDDFVQPDEFLAIRAKQGSNPGALFLGPPADEAADDRRDAEERAKRYLTRAGEADGAGHPRPLWKVAVVKGREADVADTVETLVAGGEALANVDCAWDIPAVRGFVYIAADKEALEELYESVAFVKPRPRAIAVAPEDAVAHLLGGDLPADKLKYSWVRFTGRGIYCGDLAWVQDAASPDTVHLLIVPRHGEITRPRKRSGYGAPARPPRRLHKQESDTDEQRPTPSARHNQTEFVGGLLLMRSVAVTQLCEEAVEATEDEVRLFQLSPLYAELGEARQGYSRLLEEIAAHVDRMCRMLPRAPAGSAEAAPGTRPEERMADQIRLVADRFRTVEVRAAAEAELEARARRHRQQRREEVEIRTNIIGAREARATAMRAVDKALGARGINVADMEALENEQVPPAEQWKILGEQQWLARCHKIDAEFMLEDGVARQDIESEQAVHDLALWMKLLLGNEWRGWPGGGGRDPETIRREIADKYAVREGRLPPLASTAPRAGLDDLHPGVRWLQDGADQPGFHMLWIYLLNFAREASAARRRLWDALALFNRPADPDYSELYLHCICLKEIFAVQRAPLDLAAGDSVRVCNGEYTGLVGRVEAVDGAHVEIEADNVSLNGVSLSGDRLCINAAILEYNFVVGDLVEVKHGWRVGDKGHLVDIHWDKGWGEVFRPPPALRTPSRDVDDAVAGFEMFQVKLAYLRPCWEVFLQNATPDVATEAEFGPDGRSDANDDTHVARLLKQHAKAEVRDPYRGMEVEVQQGALKGNVGTVRGSRWDAADGWTLHIVTAGRAIDTALSVPADFVVERFTGKAVEHAAHIPPRARVLVAERAAARKARRRAEERWKEGRAARQLDQRAVREAVASGSRAPPTATAAPWDPQLAELDSAVSAAAHQWLKAGVVGGVKPQANWDSRTAAASAIVAFGERVGVPAATGAIPAMAQRTGEKGHWLSNERVAASQRRMDVYVQGTQSVAPPYRGGMYEGNIGFLHLGKGIPRKKNPAIRVILGVHHRMLDFQTRFLQPMTTTERPGSNLAILPILSVPGAHVVIIGPDMNGASQWLGHRGEVREGDGETAVVQFWEDEEAETHEIEKKGPLMGVGCYSKEAICRSSTGTVV